MREGCGSGVCVDVHFVSVRVLGGCGGEFKKCRLRLFVSKRCLLMDWCVFVSKGFCWRRVRKIHFGLCGE